MSTLRSEWKYMLPFDLDLASSGFVDAHGQRISVSNLIARNPRAAQKFLKELSSLIGQRIQAYGGRRGGIVGGYTLLESLGSKDPVSSKDTPDPVQRMISKKKSQKDLQRSDTQRAISRKRWSIVKALTQWLLLWFRRRRLHTSANICVMVLRQMGEWSRIRSAMKGFVDNVTLLQRWCKRFLTVKRRRCGLCEKEWERFEDFHLSHFFRNKAQAIIQEQKELAATEAMGGQGKRQYKGIQSGKAKRDKQAFLNLLEAGVEGGEISIDFRAYKIPPAERRAIINRWYMVTLRNHVRSEQTIALTIKEMLAAER
ncbi:STK33, partial [Symbiodinium sp. CCMP2456]